VSTTPISNSEHTGTDPEHEPSSLKHEQHSTSMLRRYIDITAAIVLAIATVATAWCAYQATRWSGVQAVSFAQASTNRVESTRSFNLAIQVLSIDADLFTQWVIAYESGNAELQVFYETNLMRPEFLPYLEEWVASEPLLNSDALRNPLVNEAYQQELMAESERLREAAEERFVAATEANQTGDSYILATVMFASVLFFAGISNKFERVIIQEALVGLAFIMLVFGAIQIFQLPIH
jgi:hypothetical protein